MQAVELARHSDGTATVDLCVDCQAIWFDTYESIQLAAGGVLQLFRVIATARPQLRRALPSLMQCPRCDTALALTHDLQRTTRFSYYRCDFGHGRFTPFVQFLREKDFVRPLAPDEVERIKATIKTVRCSSCGAPVDLASATVCPYCRAPIVALDPDAMERTLRTLDAAEQQRVAPPMSDPGKLADSIIAAAQVERAYAREAREERLDLTVDLIDLGMDALAALLRNR